VGFADLTLGTLLEDVLQAHIVAGKGRFRGVRHIVARHPSFVGNLLAPPPLHLLREQTFRAGLRVLESLGLSFDAWLYHTQIGELREVAQAFPGLKIVLNHLGGPLGIGPYAGKRDVAFREWSEEFTQLANMENVYVKLGGLAMAVGGLEFHLKDLPPSSEELAKSWRPYIETAIEHFGVNRCMFESNFPVDKAMCSYRVLWNAFKRLAAGSTGGELESLFYQTAASVYRI
jgi:L-fuconolactonase